MKVTVVVTENFRIAAKPLLKKFPSLKNDLLWLEQELTGNPKMGTSLGHDAYKIRLRIGSKGKGKSGGARVITLVETTIIVNRNEEANTVNLLTIYDKSDTATITDKELKALIKNFNAGK
ncbi:hypothetical protein HRH25_13845 [Flavisolibacter sp. BT320]|nr:hypothetical protein [Flavisolibacter longurius]